MQAGARHSMPRGRHLSRTLRAFAALACWALPPAAVEAAPLDTVNSTVAAVAPPVQKAAEDVVGIALPVAGAPTPPGLVQSPSPPAGGDPVEQTVAPIGHGVGGAVPASAATVPQPQLHEPARAGLSHNAASASAERSGGRAEREQGSGVVAGRHPSPQHSVTADGSAKDVSSAAEEAKASAQPLAPSPEPDSGPMAAAAASGAAMGSLFGGGFALLVAWLLFAGPPLRRGVSMLPAVCRPAAFRVVLERPG